MKDFIKNYSRNSILISALLIILSIFLIFTPSISLKVIVIAIGVIIAANGVLHTASYFSTPQDLKMFSFELAMGIISLIVGLVFIFNPDIVNTFISFIIGAWIILKSITSLQLAFNMKSSTDKWLITLILSIFTLILGIVMLFNPFASNILVSACGIVLLVCEIANIIEIITIKKYVKLK